MKVKHLGHTGHFVAADRCLFRRHTHVGDYCVSTVGDLYYERSLKRAEIGYGRFFETMVFRLLPVSTKGRCPSCPRCPGGDGDVVYSAAYMKSADADKGHDRIVAKMGKRK